MAAKELRWISLQARGKNDQIRELRDRNTIRELLNTERNYSAYALGQLDTSLFEKTKWFHLTNEISKKTGLVMHSKGGLGEATMTFGDPYAIAKILRLHPGPSFTYMSCQPKHLKAIQKTHHLFSKQKMLRLTVDRANFKPDHGNAPIKLSGLDVHRINQLYGSEGRPTYYQATHINEGVYYGTINQGRLTAIAGTHIVSKEEQIAVVGNVYTLPRYRRQGLATAVTSPTTEELLKFCTNVVLTVDPKNTPALAAYKHLGYLEEDTLIESNARKHLGADLRALGSRLRSRLQPKVNTMIFKGYDID